MPSQRLSPDLIDLPKGWVSALVRGLRGKCPRCGEAALFRKWLKPVDRCPHCRQDWSVQQADDFPAYIGIFVVGHLLAPVAIVMLLVTLQPTKGGVIGFLWWHGIGAFKAERRALDDKS
jgi:uncharacterized protein (DUF983 family)